MKIKKYLGTLFMSILGLFGIINTVNAVSFPNSIKSSINYNYVDGNGWCTLGASGRRVCAKEYSASDSSGKAICTTYKNSAPNGVTCTPTTWSNDSKTNERVAAMIGSVIQSARASDGSITWDNYYYAEFAINRLLYYGYTGNRGYGAITNNVTSIIENAKNDSKFNMTKYNNFLSVANYTYQNYDNTRVTISSPSYNPTTGVAQAKVLCTDYAGKNISCHLTKKEIKYSTNGTDWQTVEADIVSADTISKNIGTNAVKVQFAVTDKQCWNTAKNYSCGSGYQNLTPNVLEQVCKNPSAESPIITNNIEYVLEVHKVDASDNTKYLNGATVSITKDNNSYLNDVALVNGRIDLYGVEPGHYCITEVKSPQGYAKTDENYCVDINENNKTGTIYIKNQKDDKNITINKVDEKGNPVVGAKIKIYYYDLSDISSAEEGTDVSGNVSEIAEFTTDGNPKVIPGLEVGKTYTVVEEEMPKEGGYAGGITEVEITISADDTKNVVTLTNTHSSIKVSKQSITSTKELPGAKLTITDAQGNVVASWTSTDKPQEITGLSDGDYTLTETTAPQGYTVAESIKFTIENGVVKGDEDNMVVMKDATIVEVPDTFNIQNIIAMIAGVVLVGLGTGVLFYETKKKKA